MAEHDDMNKGVIDEFRANAGAVGGYFASAPIILVNTIGAKSGNAKTFPLVYLPDAESWVIFASAGGALKHPAWYHNLKANPDVTIEVGDEIIEAHATEVTGAERDELYAKQAGLMSNFAEYEKLATTRKIPVVRLTRR
jgi:deazaflavin-dependent oxidoreductase (nitroreductase family)